MSDETLTKAMTKFALAIYRKAADMAGGQSNVFISPISITCALGMTYAGAAGETKAQLKRVLFGETDDADIHPGLRQIMETLTGGDTPCTLQMANKLYGHEPAVGELQKSYLKLVKKYYGSNLDVVDFRNSEPVRQEINDFVSEATNEKIKDLLPKGALSGDTRLVLVNAIYFKGDWATKFSKNHTKKRPFYVAPDEEIQVDMMVQRQDKFMHTEKEECQVLGLPYTGDNLVMYIILPKEKYGLAALERELDGAKFLALIDDCDKKVEISTVMIPKFKLEHSLGLVKALQQLGVSVMFDPESANFSPINGKGNLFVSDLVHKAFVEVNEEGTKAAAATATVMYCSSINMEFVFFIADHPFLFAIMDKRTKSILFLGRFYG